MKIKNRYILQPTQKSFIESCPLGERLIKRMGWKDGQSLGVNDKGIKECIKLKYQIETKGLGYKNTDNSHLSVLNNDYDNLLASLNKDLESKTPDVQPSSSKQNKSLKVKIKSKHRYTKISRNKDINNYSKEDLKQITGILSL